MYSNRCDCEAHGNQEQHANNSKRTETGDSGGHHHNCGQCRKRKRRSSSTDTIIADDQDGFLQLKPEDIMKHRYRVKRIIGQGTFSQVVHVVDLQDRQQGQPNCLALKIIKNIGKYREAAKFEINVLEHIKKPFDSKSSSNSYLNEIMEQGRTSCIQMLNWFDYHGHICISFQLLGRSVYDFMKMNSHQPYPFKHIRAIGYQLILAVNFLHHNKIIHTDLKPENIVFVNDAYDIEYPDDKLSGKIRRFISVKEPTIRLVDFGSAIFSHEHHSKVVSTRHYRAIEVILELGWSYPCDVWSIGCILFELFTGITMFQTHDNREHLAMMERILGTIPYRMATRSKTKYFNRHGWLNWIETSSAGYFVRRNCRPLKQYLSNHSKDELDLFDLIDLMLTYEPKHRITCAEALRHSFLEYRGKPKFSLNNGNNNNINTRDDSIS